MPDNFFQYDFNCPEKIPAKYHHHFDFVVADPPFITHDVWSKYATAIKLILKENGAILLSTVVENEEHLQKILSVRMRKFKPSIPNLVYQYALYSNFEDERLERANPEIAE